MLFNETLKIRKKIASGLIILLVINLTLPNFANNVGTRSEVVVTKHSEPEEYVEEKQSEFEVGTESEILVVEQCEFEEAESCESNYRSEQCEPEEELEQSEFEDVIATESELVELKSEIVGARITRPYEMEYCEPDDNIATESEADETLKIADEGADSIYSNEIATNSETDVETDFIQANETATNSEISDLSIKDYSYDGFLDPGYEVPYYENEDIGLFGAGDTLPSSYDSRNVDNDYGIPVVPIEVRNQSTYDICWAFSVIGMAETSIRKKNLASNEDDSNLSELALAYWTLNLKSVTNNDDKIDKPGLEGHDYSEINNSYFEAKAVSPPKFSKISGNQMEPLFISSSYMGFVKEDNNTKYDKITTVENNGLDGSYAFNNNDYELLNVTFLNKNNIDNVKRAIIENGSVGISYYENRNDYNCHEHNGEWYYLPEANPINHTALIVGWDDNISKEYFYNDTGTSVSEDGAWLVRNSYGGNALRTNGGYYWLSYESPSLNSNMYSVEMTEKDTYKYNYHYDTTGLVNFKPLNEGNKVSNIFKVNDEDQTLDAVNIILGGNNSEFDLEIWTKDSEMSNPTDGVKVGSYNFVKPFPGIWTIDLPDSISLKKDTYFSIVLIPRANLNLYVDDISEGGVESQRNHYNEVKLGQSYKFENGQWVDINENKEMIDGTLYGESYRIKGLTNPGLIVSFKATDGEEISDYQVVKENKLTKLNKNKFEREGYRFLKWTDGEGNDYLDEGNIIITEDITLTAEWEETGVYNIKYDLCGVNATTPSDTIKTLLVDCSLNEPTNIPMGYTFLGWYEDSDLVSEYVGNGDLTNVSGSSVYVYAKWKREALFDKRGHGIEDISPIEIINNSITFPSLSEPGYEFGGWYSDMSLDVFCGNATETYNLTEPKMFYAKWIPTTYTITYDANGGEFAAGTITSIQKIFDTAATLPSSPTKLGYAFVGWYANNTETVEAGLSEAENAIKNGTKWVGNNELYKIPYMGGDYTFKSETVVYAKWKQTEYKIIYNLNGVSASIGSGFSIKTYDTNVGLLTPASYGQRYRFKNWYKDEELNEVYYGTDDSIYANGADVHIYAKWEVLISFVCGPGQNIPSKWVEKGKVATLSDMSAIGYEFEGWYADVTYDTYVGGGGTEYVADAKTFYSKWRGITYTIKYDLLGFNATTPSDTTKIYGVMLVPSKPTNIQTGYVFKAWYTDRGLTNEYSINSDLATEEGAVVTLYAKFGLPVKYTIIYETNGGIVSRPSINKTFGQNVTLDIPTRDNYTFVGWYQDRYFVFPYAGESDLSGTDGAIVTIYAKWDRIVATDTTTDTSTGGSSGGGGGGGGRGSSISLNLPNTVNAVNNVVTNTSKTTTLAVSFSSVPINFNTTYSAWGADEKGNWHLYSLNNWGLIIENKNTWTCLKKYVNGNEITDFYYFNGNGEMLTGWLADKNEKKYFLNDEENSEKGKLVRGWKKIDNNWYYFDNNGVLFVNGKTPDGYNVDTNGIYKP